MLQILNKTPFEAALTLMTDQHGVEKVVVAVKATFAMPNADQDIYLAEEQLPVLYTDEYFEAPGESSVKYPADLVLEKAGTDIGFVGSAHTPNGRLVTSLRTALQVGNLRKDILVTGDRQWKKNTMRPGFTMTAPVPFREMPIRFERAFGGADQSHKKEKKQGWEKSNPIGSGFLLNKDAVDGHALPNLEDPKQWIKSWKDKPTVAGYGFLDGAWEPRVSFAGTYDEKWQENQFPLLPADIGSRFFNSAMSDLQANGFLKGGEPVYLRNLSKRGDLPFRLPEIKMTFMFRLGESRNEQDAPLYTVVFEPDENRFYMVWGGAFGYGKQPTKMRYVKIEMDGQVQIHNSESQNSQVEKMPVVAT